MHTHAPPHFCLLNLQLVNNEGHFCLHASQPLLHRLQLRLHHPPDNAGAFHSFQDLRRRLPGHSHPNDATTSRVSTSSFSNTFRRVESTRSSFKYRWASHARHHAAGSAAPAPPSVAQGTAQTSWNTAAARIATPRETPHQQPGQREPVSVNGARRPGSPLPARSQSSLPRSWQ